MNRRKRKVKRPTLKYSRILNEELQAVINNFAKGSVNYKQSFEALVWYCYVNPFRKFDDDEFEVGKTVVLNREDAWGRFSSKSVEMMKELVKHGYFEHKFYLTNKRELVQEKPERERFCNNWIYTDKFIDLVSNSSVEDAEVTDVTAVNRFNDHFKRKDMRILGFPGLHFCDKYGKRTLAKGRFDITYDEFRFNMDIHYNEKSETLRQIQVGNNAIKRFIGKEELPFSEIDTEKRKANWENYTKQVWNSIENFNRKTPVEKRYSISSDGYGYRIYTVISDFPREIKSYYKIDDEPLKYSMDLSQSQPTIAARVLSELHPEDIDCKFVKDVNSGEFYKRMGEILGCDKPATKQIAFNMMFSNVYADIQQFLDEVYPVASKMFRSIKTSNCKLEINPVWLAKGNARFPRILTQQESMIFQGALNDILISTKSTRPVILHDALLCTESDYLITKKYLDLHLDDYFKGSNINYNAEPELLSKGEK